MARQSLDPQAVRQATVHITLRKGGGRGAYEITGLKEVGRQRRDVLDKSLVLSVAEDVTLFTRLRVVLSGGKLRFITEHEHLNHHAPNRSQSSVVGNKERINRQLAAALLMPTPTGYSDTPAEGSMPSRDGYMIWSIEGHFNGADASSFVVSPTGLTLRNGSGDLLIDPRVRAAQVSLVWSGKSLFPRRIRELIAEHETAVRSGQPIDKATCDVASDIQAAMANDPDGRWPGVTAEMDPLPALVQFLTSAGVRFEPYVASHMPTPIVYSSEEAAAAYVPDNTDQRERVIRQIAARRGQSRFRDALRTRFGDVCLISGCRVIDAIEAAHIVPYRGERDNNIENGLLLRADLHTLFDLDLVGIEPESLAVHLHPKLLVSDGYGAYENVLLRCPSSARPSRSALQARYQSFRDRTGSP